MGTLFAADIQNAPIGHVEDGLQGQRALPDAWLSTKEDDGTWNKTATENAVELTVVHVHAWSFLSGNLLQKHRTGLAFKGGAQRGGS